MIYFEQSACTWNEQHIKYSWGHHHGLRLHLFWKRSSSILNESCIVSGPLPTCSHPPHYRPQVRIRTHPHLDFRGCFIDVNHAVYIWHWALGLIYNKKHPLIKYEYSQSCGSVHVWRHTLVRNLIGYSTAYIWLPDSTILLLLEKEIFQVYLKFHVCQDIIFCDVMKDWWRICSNPSLKMCTLNPASHWVQSAECWVCVLIGSLTLGALSVVTSNRKEFLFLVNIAVSYRWKIPKANMDLFISKPLAFHNLIR